MMRHGLRFGTKGLLSSLLQNGGVLVSTGSLSSELHAEDDSLASLKSRIKNINVNSNELALAA